MKTTTAIFSGLFAFMILASAAVIVAADEFATTQPDEEGAVNANEEGLGYIDNETTAGEDQTEVADEGNMSLPQGPMCVLIIDMGPMRMILIFPWNETFMNGSAGEQPYNLSAIIEWFKNWTSGLVMDHDQFGCGDMSGNRTLPPDMLNRTEPRNCTGNRSFEKDGNLTMRDLYTQRHPGHRMGRAGHHFRPMEVSESEAS